MTMSDKQNGARSESLAPPQDEFPIVTADSTPEIDVESIKPTSKRGMRKLCRGCFPRRMTEAEIERGNYGGSNADA